MAPILYSKPPLTLAANLPSAVPGLGEELMRVITLADYNTRLVVLSTAILGAAAGLIGTFLLLRKRALMSDALSHATLPGIAIAFMVMVALGGSGKAIGGLIAGATVFGLLGVAGVLLIRRFSRLHDDAALGIVLSVFFGLGVALLGIVQELPEASAAGLESFVYGKAASMVQRDLLFIAITGAVVGGLCLLFRREFALLCFDDDFAATQGLPVTPFDILMLALVTAVTVTGLQAVGLILIIALLIIPPAAARFWTDRIGAMLLLSAVFGAVCGWVGSSISALAPRLPSGAIIVLVGSAIFVISLFLGIRRGVLRRMVRAVQVRREVGRQNLLRSLYELKYGEPEAQTPVAVDGREERSATPRSGRSVPTVSFDALLARRSWSRISLWMLLRRARWRGRVEVVSTPDLNTRSDAGPARSVATAQTDHRSTPTRRYRLTAAGIEEAERVVRNHRLWEVFLLRYADIAPSHVDRAADQIEHVLGSELVDELERELRVGETPSPVASHGPRGSIALAKGGGVHR